MQFGTKWTIGALRGDDGCGDLRTGFLAIPPGSGHCDLQYGTAVEKSDRKASCLTGRASGGLMTYAGIYKA